MVVFATTTVEVRKGVKEQTEDGDEEHRKHGQSPLVAQHSMVVTEEKAKPH